MLAERLLSVFARSSRRRQSDPEIFKHIRDNNFDKLCEYLHTAQNLSVNELDSYGYTPLQVACANKEGDERIIARLLEVPGGALRSLRGCVDLTSSQLTSQLPSRVTTTPHFITFASAFFRQSTVCRASAHRALGTTSRLSMQMRSSKCSSSLALT